MLNAGAVELVEATVAAGASPGGRPQVVVGRAGPARQRRGCRAGRCSPITPAQVAELQRLVDDGTLTDYLARQALDGVLAGEGDPEQVVAARGLRLVSDDAALGAAVDAAIAANPDVAEKVRGGKVAAAGALVGAVMRDMRGQADAAKVRTLVLSRLAPADDGNG